MNDYSFIFADTETTGLDSRKYDIVELSLYRLKDDVQKTWIIKPINPQNYDLEALKINGKIDILVNNAGITRDNLILRLSEKDYLDVIQTNLNGSFYCMKLAAAHMIKNRQGTPASDPEEMEEIL